MGQNPKRKVKLAPWGWFLWILIWYNRHHVISCQLLYCIWHERSVLEKLWKNGAQIHVRSLYVNLSYFSLVFYFILSFSILFHFLLFYFNLSISHFCQAQFQLASPVPVELRLAPPGKVKMHLEIDHIVSWRQEQARAFGLFRVLNLEFQIFRILDSIEDEKSQTQNIGQKRV